MRGLGTIINALAIVMGGVLGILFKRFGEWLKHKTGSDGDFMNRNLTRSVIV